MTTIKLAAELAAARDSPLSGGAGPETWTTTSGTEVKELVRSWLTVCPLRWHARRSSPGTRQADSFGDGALPERAPKNYRLCTAKRSPPRVEIGQKAPP